MNKSAKPYRVGEKGAVAVLVAVLLMFLIGMVALVVDVGYLYATRSELQNAADAAALAGARQLGFIYEGMPYPDQQSYDCESCLEIKNAAMEFMNQAGGISIQIQLDDVDIGRWSNQTFTPTSQTPDAVRVRASRVEGRNGPLLTFFAGLFGKDSFDLRAQAVAALTAQSSVGAGELEVPVGIPTYFFDYHKQAGLTFCDENIKLYPANDPTGCAGWHVFDEKNANKPTLEKIIDGANPEIPDVIYESPAIDIGTSPEFAFSGGNVTAVWDNLHALFEARKDPGTGSWETLLAVYESTDCSNPNQDKPIVGFATVIIDKVLVVPEKTIQGLVKCDNVEFGRGSGGEYGTKGSVPGLVR